MVTRTWMLDIIMQQMLWVTVRSGGVNYLLSFRTSSPSVVNQELPRFRHLLYYTCSDMAIDAKLLTLKLTLCYSDKTKLQISILLAS
jgi:hypothetical protein